MNRRCSFAVVGLFVLASSASSNFGPPPLPKDRKVLSPPVRFVGLDKYPNRVFFLHYGSFYFGQDVVEVKDSKQIVLDFKVTASKRAPVPYLWLRSMTREDFEKRKKRDPSLEWLRSSSKGVLSVKLSPPPATAPKTAKDVPVTTYSVRVHRGVLTARKIGRAKRVGLLPTWVAGVVCSLALVWFGLWFARGSLRSQGVARCARRE